MAWLKVTQRELVTLRESLTHRAFREASARSLTSRNNSIIPCAVASGRLLYARNISANPSWVPDASADISGVPIRADTVKMTSSKAAGSP